MPSLHAFEQELLAAAVPRKMQRVWALNDAPNRGAAGSSAPPMRPQRDTAVPASLAAKGRLHNNRRVCKLRWARSQG
jgi:hypothetical protein